MSEQETETGQQGQGVDLGKVAYNAFRAQITGEDYTDKSNLYLLARYEQRAWQAAAEAVKAAVLKEPER